MTDPADSDQLHNAVSLQGATIGRHEELLQCLMEGLHTWAERHDQNAIPWMPHWAAGHTNNLPAYPSVPRTLFTSSGALRRRFQNLLGFSLPVLPYFRSEAFFVSLGPLKDRVHYNADVREGTRPGLRWSGSNSPPSASV